MAIANYQCEKPKYFFLLKCCKGIYYYLIYTIVQYASNNMHSPLQIFFRHGVTYIMYNIYLALSYFKRVLFLPKIIRFLMFSCACAKFIN